MILDYGYAKYDIQIARLVFSWKSLLDYDPNSSSLDLAVGDHFYIYHQETVGYFLYCRHRIQYSFGGEVVDGQEYIQPISSESVAIYAMLHNLNIIKMEKLERYFSKLTDTLKLKFTEDSEGNIQTRKDFLIEIDRILESKKLENLDMKYDFSELRGCFAIGAYRAALTLMGRILEFQLKIFCQRNSIKLDEKSMIGQIIKSITDSGFYLDPSLVKIWEIINQQRIIGVHIKENAPIPSREQALMVGFAVIETIKRLSE